MSIFPSATPEAYVPVSPQRYGLAATTPPTIQGRVERLSPIVDQASGTVKVTVAIEPKPGFRPGSFVRVEIRTDTKSDAIVIPKRALIEEDGQNYVFIAQNDTAKRAKVELGYQREGLVEIRNGVSPGRKRRRRRAGRIERRRQDQGALAPNRERGQAFPRRVEGGSPP